MNDSIDSLVNGSLFDYDLHSWLVNNISTFLFHNELPFQEIRSTNNDNQIRFLRIEKKKNGIPHLFWLQEIDELELIEISKQDLNASKLVFRGENFTKINFDEGVVEHSKSKIRERAKTIRYTTSSGLNLFLHYLSEDRYEGRIGEKIEEFSIKNILQPTESENSSAYKKPFQEKIDPRTKSKRFNFSFGCALILVLLLSIAILLFFFVLRGEF